MQARIALLTLLATASFTLPAGAQNSASIGVDGSKSKAEASLAGRAVVGYLETTSGSGVQPIVGVAGASRVGEEIDFGVVLSAAAVAPAGGYAVGVVADTGEVAILDLESESVAALPDVPPGPDRILFGPSGGAVGLYYRAGAELIAVSDPMGSREIQGPLSVAGPGIVTALAIADSGKLALAAYATEASAAVYSLAASGPQFVTQVSRVSDLRFLPDSNDALITDSGASEVILVTNIGESSTVQVVADADSGLESPIAAASTDGETAYVLAGGTITALDLTTGEATAVDCRCQASGLEAVGHGSRFHLTGKQPGAIALLDSSGGGSGETATILLVPARPAASLTISNSRSPGRSRSR